MKTVALALLIATTGLANFAYDLWVFLRPADCMIVQPANLGDESRSLLYKRDVSCLAAGF